ncbi:MAG: hypothetical protein F4136_11465, partial [Chloroflexi bacterium]|nr:hypothetical protein [Chloroflexota bacterium]
MLDRLLGHWLLAVAMILVAAALTIPQIDKYPLSVDSLHSYAMALGLTESIGSGHLVSDATSRLYSMM